MGAVEKITGQPLLYSHLLGNIACEQEQDPDRHISQGLPLKGQDTLEANEDLIVSIYSERLWDRLSGAGEHERKDLVKNAKGVAGKSRAE